jgi:pimeloyl-ACP methyl ester carboxylesterase
VTDLQAVVAPASPNNIPGGMHNGFKSAYDTVSAQLSEALKAGREQKTPTYFVGHSLGGALAVIASSEQHKAGVNVAGVVTLGQPRVGNAEFTAAFEKALQNKYNRYVYENDPVPHLPPSQSTGNQVSSVVSGVNGIGGLLSSGMGLLFSRAAFTHAAAPQTLGNARFSSSGFTNDDEWDKSYWGSNASAVGQIVANPQSALKDSVVADHDVNKYLCSMLEKVDSN